MQKSSLVHRKFNRRHALRIAAVGIMSSTAAAVVGTQQLTGADSAAAGEVTVPAADLSDIQPSAAALFDEIYRGRHITAASDQPADHVATSGTNTTDTNTTRIPLVLVDGVALHVMANANGTYTSVINHYQSFRSLHEVARAAVDSLGDAALVHVRHDG